MKPILKSLYQNSRNEKIKKLIFVAFNKDWSIRSSVAQNINWSVYILERLSNDQDYSVRKNARNPNWIFYI